MNKSFSAKDQFFWLSLFLLAICIIKPVAADGTSSNYQDPASIKVTGPEGAHVPPNVFPLYAGDTLTENLSAGFNQPTTGSSGQECKIDSKTFNYINIVTTYSPDGIKPFVTGVGGAGISSADAAGNAVLSAGFPSPGYYKITYTLRVSYKSATCGDGHADSPGSFGFAVAAGDFSFTLIPGSLTINQGESDTTYAQISSFKNFAYPVNFSAIASDVPGFSASGSGTPPINGTTQDELKYPNTQYPNAPVTVSVGSSVPVGSHSMYIRGSSTVGSIVLSHDQPFSVSVTKRGLTIKRAGAHDEKLDASGNAFAGDTVYSSDSTTVHNGVPIQELKLNTQTFAIGFLGTWHMITVGINSPQTQPNVNFIWSPNESDDTYSKGYWQVPYGTISYFDDGVTGSNPIGNRDNPAGQTITYTATDNVSNVSKSVSYGLTVHDQVEGMTHTVHSIETAPTPLFGSDGTVGGGLYRVEGLFTPGKNVPPVINKGIEHSSGWSIDVGVDIPFDKWAEEFSFSPSISYTHDQNDTTGATVAVDIAVPLNYFTYPEYINTYNRHFYTWREFDQGGEIILHNADNSVKPHTHQEDVYAADRIVWATPMRDGTPFPQYSPTPVYIPR